MIYVSEVVLANEENSIMQFKNRYNINLNTIYNYFKDDLERYYQESNAHLNYDEFLDNIGIYTVYSITGLSIIQFIIELSMITKTMVIPFIYNNDIIVIEKN